MLLFCFYNEYISLQINEIYKMSIVEIDKNMLLDVKIYNSLIHKAKM